MAKEKGLFTTPSRPGYMLKVTLIEPGAWHGKSAIFITIIAGTDYFGCIAITVLITDRLIRRLFIDNIQLQPPDAFIAVVDFL